MDCFHTGMSGQTFDLVDDGFLNGGLSTLLKLQSSSLLHNMVLLGVFNTVLMKAKWTQKKKK